MSEAAAGVDLPRSETARGRRAAAASCSRSSDCSGTSASTTFATSTVPGDEGGDLLAFRQGYRWVFQCKWKKRGLVPETAVREVDAAKAFYQADRAVVATNRAPGVKAKRLRDKLLGVGVRIDFWKDDTLAKFADEVIPEYVPSRFEPYPYQAKAIAKAKAALEEDNQALVIMATGLGKTVVGGEIVDWQLQREPEKDVLVVAHVKELVRQLERAMWRHIPKSRSDANPHR